MRLMPNSRAHCSRCGSDPAKVRIGYRNVCGVCWRAAGGGVLAAELSCAQCYTPLRDIAGHLVDRETTEPHYTLAGRCSVVAGMGSVPIGA